VCISGDDPRFSASFASHAPINRETPTNPLLTQAWKIPIPVRSQRNPQSTAFFYFTQDLKVHKKDCVSRDEQVVFLHGPHTVTTQDDCWSIFVVALRRPPVVEWSSTRRINTSAKCCSPARVSTRCLTDISSFGAIAKKKLPRERSGPR
jgi:hypothetical protein